MPTSYESYEEFLAGMSDFEYDVWYYQEATPKQRKIANRFREVSTPRRNIDIPLEQEQPTFTIKDFAKYNHTTYSIARSRLARMEKKGEVERISKGVYRIK